MTDADRLRAAADRVAGVYTTIDPTPQDAATAALLRAVAEYHPVECSFARYGHVCTPYCPRCRAEALADTILGGES